MGLEAVLIGGPGHGQVRDISRWVHQVPPYPGFCGYIHQAAPLPTEEAWQRYLAQGEQYTITSFRYAHVAECQGIHYYGLV